VNNDSEITIHGIFFILLVYKTWNFNYSF
jgi:hypothetical protein